MASAYFPSRISPTICLRALATVKGKDRDEKDDLTRSASMIFAVPQPLAAGFAAPWSARVKLARNVWVHWPSPLSSCLA
jgi:hypothetical protein